MKAKLIRDDLECVTSTPDEEQTVVNVTHRNGKDVKRRYWILGAIINDPDAYRLVQLGVAVPMDDECKKAANMSSDDMKAAELAANRLAAGIDPDDYDLFDRGVILGYKDGSYVPGPNFHELEELEEFEEGE